MIMRGTSMYDMGAEHKPKSTTTFPPQNTPVPPFHQKEQGAGTRAGLTLEPRKNQFAFPLPKNHNGGVS